MGPSILLSSVTETVAFALGAMVPMPAVRNFAIYAAGSVFLGAVMQVTVFVSAMAVDLKRAEVSLSQIPKGDQLLTVRQCEWTASLVSGCARPLGSMIELHQLAKAWSPNS
jgi:uncharacterized membrane protein YdfJ with MMPL/SSD domain